MTELKFKVSTEDPEALLKLAEICKSIAVAYVAADHVGSVPSPPVDTTGAPAVMPPTTFEPQLSEVSGIPNPDPEPQTQAPDLELQTQIQTPFSKLAAPEVDSKGRPWDIRIHSSSKNKLKKTGEWKLKRGADPALVTQLLNAPLTQIQEPTQTQTQEPAQTAGPIQENLFTTLMTNLTKWLGEGTMNMKHVNDVLARFNVPSVEYLQTCNDNNLISTVNFKLVEQWQLLNPNPA